jgi:hypothetical protein
MRAEALPIRVANGEDLAPLRRAIRLLDSIPPGDLDLAALAQVHQVTLVAAHPHRGELREAPMVIKLNGALHKPLPTPHEAQRLADQAMRWLPRSTHG